LGSRKKRGGGREKLRYLLLTIVGAKEKMDPVFRKQISWLLGRKKKHLIVDQLALKDGKVIDT